MTTEIPAKRVAKVFVIGLEIITTGRDLLRLQTQSPSRQAPLVIANPNYNASRSEVKVTNTTRSTEDNRISVDMNSLKFASALSASLRHKSLLHLHQ